MNLNALDQPLNDAKLPELAVPWPAFVEELRQLPLPPDVLPLAKERYPFKGLHPELIAKIAFNALTTTTLRGRLTDLVRRHAGLAPIAPFEYYILEAHIDLTLVDDYSM